MKLMCSTHGISHIHTFIEKMYNFYEKRDIQTEYGVFHKLLLIPTLILFLHFITI